MSEQSRRAAIGEAMDRLFDGNPLRSDGKLTVKSLAVEAGVPRHQLTEVHTDLKDLFYARLRNEELESPALVVERQRRDAAVQEAKMWRERAQAAEAGVDELIRALHIVIQSQGREGQVRPRLTPVPD